MTARPQPGFEAIMADMQKATVDAQLARMQAAMDEMARNNEALKIRIQNMESTAPSYNNRLGQLERTMQPYDEYSEQCNKTIDQFKKIKVRLEAERNDESKRNQALNSRLDAFDQRLQAVNQSIGLIPGISDDQRDAKDSIKSLLLRVQHLEEQASYISDRAVLKTISAQDLAKALVNRLSSGETLDEPTLLQLALSLDSTSSKASLPDRLPFTPSTDLEPAERAAGQLNAAQEAPRSRKRARNVTDDANTLSVSTAAANTSPATKRRSRLSKSTAATADENIQKELLPDAVEEVEQAENDDEKEVENEREASPVPIRRSGREPKPSSKHGDYLTWKQVRDRRRETG